MSTSTVPPVPVKVTVPASAFVTFVPIDHSFVESVDAKNATKPFPNAPGKVEVPFGSANWSA